MKKPTLQYAVLGILLAWALLAQLTYSSLLIYIQAHSSEYLGLPYDTNTYSTQISSVAQPYANIGLLVGDDVIALNGRRLIGVQQMEDLGFGLRSGETLRVTVRRNIGGTEQTITIPVRMQPSAHPAVGWARVIGISTFLPLSGLIIGFYIAFARPRDPLAWITMAMLASFGQFTGSSGMWGIWAPWRQITLLYYGLLENSWPLWLLLFALYFPVPFAFIERRRWVNWIIAAPMLGLGILGLIGDFREGTHVRELGWLANLFRVARPWITVLFSLYVWAFFALLSWKARVVTDRDARRRLNVMLAGCSVSLLPVFFVVLSELHVLPLLPVWLTTLCLLMLVFFPLTMAYVIVVQRAMDVRMVIRAGVRYALASTGVKVLRLASITALAMLTAYLAGKSGHWTQSVLIGLIGAAVISVFSRWARRVSSWVDRRFFREAYNAELILTDLGNSVTGIRDVKVLVETVANRISESLHVPQIAVLLEQHGRYAPAYAVGFDGQPPYVAFDRTGTTARVLREMRSPSKIYFDDPQSWVHGTPQTEQEALKQLEAEVLLPLNTNNRMLGLIALGRKRSAVPYSKGDLQLLSAVASQTGLALDNARLTESIKEEVAQRERLNRELEIASEVQRRLFPQKAPKVPGLDVDGYCRPALGVGGDYYDFFELSNGGLALAVGDVSGKGIAAALMMASLQASLRGQTIRPSSSLSEMISLVNRLVYENSAQNRYATFFYAQYDPSTRALRYVNAGHNPPLLCRRNGAGHEILRLDEGGTVLGLFPDYAFKEAQVSLHAGDVLVAYTDGISEAMNVREEEWDEERLITALAYCKAPSAKDTIEWILQQVDAFTAGAPQHDDMTLLVARVE